MLSDAQTGLYKLHRTSTVDNGENCFLSPFDTQTGMHEIHRTSTMVKTASWTFSGTQTDMNKLRRTLTVVKPAFWIFPDTQLCEQLQAFRKYLSPFWRSYEAIVHMFLCQEGSWKQILLLWRSCESSARLFECQEGPWNHFSPLLKSSDPFWYSNWPFRASQDFRNGESCIQGLYEP